MSRLGLAAALYLVGHRLREVYGLVYVRSCVSFYVAHYAASYLGRQDLEAGRSFFVHVGGYGGDGLQGVGSFSRRISSGRRVGRVRARVSGGLYALGHVGVQIGVFCASSCFARVVYRVFYRALYRHYSGGFVLLASLFIRFASRVVGLSFCQSRLGFQVRGSYQTSCLFYAGGLVVLLVLSQYYECGRRLVGLAFGLVGVGQSIILHE